MDIAEKLKKLRGLRRLTASDLARLSGVHQTTISAIENRRHSSPGIETVEKLAKVLKVSPLYFFEERSRTPFDLIDQLPPDISNFLLHEESLPYLLLSKEAYSKGISSKTIEQLLKIIQENQKEQRSTTEPKRGKKKTAFDLRQDRDISNGGEEGIL